jgi:orotate phosphoribosyltransferase
MHGLEASDFVALVSGRRGHFRLESGHHGGLWLDLDALFADPRRITPFVTALAHALRPYAIEAVCGPMLGGAFLAQLVAQALDVEFCFTERHAPVDESAMFAVRYRLPPAFRGRVAGRRVAMVDDVMSAGSALRGTHADLLSHGAVPVVAGALLVLGSTGAAYFGQRGVAVEAVTRDRFDLWPPAECPLCAEGVPLESPAGVAA